MFYTAIEGELANVSRAVRRLRQEYGPLVEVFARARRDITGPEKIEELLAIAARVNLIVLRLMGGPDSLPAFDRLGKLAREKNISLAVLPSVGEDDTGLFNLSTLTYEDYRLVRQYVSYGRIANIAHLLLWAVNRHLGAQFSVEEPRPLLWEGFYHPDCPDEKTAEAYLRQRVKEKERLVVGILFYQSYWTVGNIAFVDDFVREIERQGGIALPVFLYATRDDEMGSRGITWVVDNYFSGTVDRW